MDQMSAYCVPTEHCRTLEPYQVLNFIKEIGLGGVLWLRKSSTTPNRTTGHLYLYIDYNFKMDPYLVTISCSLNNNFRLNCYAATTFFSNGSQRRFSGSSSFWNTLMTTITTTITSMGSMSSGPITTLKGNQSTLNKKKIKQRDKYTNLSSVPVKLLTYLL